MRVGMIISTYYPVRGGAQKLLDQIAHYLKCNGVEMFILTRRTPGTKSYEVMNGVPVHRIPVTNRFKIVDSMLYLILSVAWLVKNRSQYDLLHCQQMYSPASIAVIVKLILKNKRVAVTVTSSDEYGEVRELMRLPFLRTRMKLLRHVDRFFVVNDKAGEELCGIGIDKTKVIYMPNGVVVPKRSGIDSAFKVKMKEKMGLAGVPVALFVGRLAEEKNIVTLLRSWKLVSNVVPRALLLILGAAGRERDCEEKIMSVRMELGLEESVRMMGWTNNVVDYMNASDVFVLPSVSEGMSMALLEAMASGLGVVASDNSGNRQVVQDGISGLIVDAKDEAAIANAIIRLMTDEQYRKTLGRNARAYVERECSMQKISSRHVEEYRALLS